MSGPETKTRSLSFQADTDVETVEIESWKQMSEEERTAQWYSKKELADYRAAERLLLARVARGDDIPEEDFSVRGLESKLTPDANFAKKTAVLEAVQSVLDAQDRQRYASKSVDPQSLADISRDMSKATRRNARKLAREDAMSIPEVAEKIYEEHKLRIQEKELRRLKEERVKSQSQADASKSPTPSRHRRRIADFFTLAKPSRS